MRRVFDDIVKKIRIQRQNNPSTDFGKGMVNGAYEIPVVVHVVYPNGAAVGSAYNKSDAQVQAWLDRANQMYAGTYAWPASGTPADFGTISSLSNQISFSKKRSKL